MKKRVCVYVDGANFYGGMTSVNSRYTDVKFDFERYIKSLVKGNFLVKIYYYNGSLKRQVNAEIFRKQQRLFSRLRLIENCEVVVCKRKPRVDSYGREFHAIKADDVCLALDMLGDAYENRYDEAILISSDGDFVPLVRRVRKLGKVVRVCYFEGCVAGELLGEADEVSLIDKRVVRKFFWMGNRDKT